MGVGAMKDENLKLMDLRSSYYIGNVLMNTQTNFFCYEQQIKREVKRIHTSGCLWNERLKPKTDGFIYNEQQIKREVQRIRVNGCRCHETLKSEN